MTRRHFAFPLILAAFALRLSVIGLAQASPTPSPPAAPPPPPPPVEIVVEPAATPPAEPTPTQDAPADEQNSRQDVVRMGQDYVLGAGQTVGDLVIINGNITINGHVDGDTVAVFGSIRLGSTASVDGDLVSIGGSITAAEGATAGGDVVAVGGTLDTPSTFRQRGEYVAIDPSLLGMKIAGIVPYFTRGLMWGRFIVPGLAWVWGAVGLFFLVYLVINVFAAAPVRAVAGVLTDKTLTAFGAGLLVFLLLGPVFLLLAISVVGLLVIPLVACAVLVATLVGKVGALRWVGLHLMRDETPDAPLRSIAVFALGFAIVSLGYMVPILGIAIWVLLSTLGLGAATLAVVAAYQREHPAAPPVPPVSPAPVGEETPQVTSFPVAETPAPASAPGSPATSDMLLLPRAAFGGRLAALVLDIILVGLVAQLLGPLRGMRMVALGLLVYHIGFWTWKQTTIGGIICHLRITRINGSPMRLADGLVRGLSSIFSVVVFGLGFLWVLKDPERQAWHDKIAGTYVVKVPADWPT